jgi:hypothetical protein
MTDVVPTGSVDSVRVAAPVEPIVLVPSAVVPAEKTICPVGYPVAPPVCAVRTIAWPTGADVEEELSVSVGVAFETVRDEVAELAPS